MRRTMPPFAVSWIYSDFIKMRFNFRPWLNMAILCLSHTTVAGAEALSLPQALSLAEKHSPAFRVATGQAHGAQASLETAGAYPNPEIEFGSGISRLLPTTTQYGRNRLLTVSQPIELPTVRSARQKAAEAGVISGNALLDEARLNLYAQIKQSFLEIQRREDEMQLAEQGRALLEQIRNRVKLRVEVGEAPRYEKVKAEAEALAAENVLLSAGVKVRQAKDRLRTLIGAPLPDQLEIVPEPVKVVELPELKALREELLLNQPLLKAAGAETQRAEAKVQQERSMRFPQPTLKWSAEQQPDSNMWRVGVSLPLPLWDRRSGQVGEAVANLERARADEDRIRFGVLSELDQAYGRYQIAQRQLNTFESGLLREAESALNVAEAAYRYGERGILDYLDAQRVLRSTRMHYLTARYELQFALVDIERLRTSLLTGEQP